MKRLFLLRHAKSSWDDPQMADRDRPLNARGLRDAPRMGAYMLEKGYIPDSALCSAARRTRETAEAVGGAIGNFPISYSEALYLAEPTGILQVIMRDGGSADALLVVGHNPGIGNLASQLTDFESLSEAQAVGNFPTAALAVFEADVEAWSDLGDKRLKLIDYMTPKALI